MSEQKPSWFTENRLTIILTVVGLLIAVPSCILGVLDLRDRFGKSTPTAQETAKTTLPASRPFQPPMAVLRAIADDLEKQEKEARPRQRYLTLTHRSNNPECSDAELNEVRQGLNQLAAYLSPLGQAAIIRPINVEQTVYALDLGELGRDDAFWGEILKADPYRLNYEGSKREGVREMAQKVRDLSGGPAAFVRADWLMQAAIRPPLGGKDGSLKLAIPQVPPKLRDLAQNYAAQTLDLQGAAAELGLADAKELENLLHKEEDLRKVFGLAPLLKNGRVSRAAWESSSTGASAFQEAARLLRLGTPAGGV